MTAVVAPKDGSHLLLAINKQNNIHTISPQNQIAFIMPCPKVIGSRHRSGTGNNQDRQRTTPCDNGCFNRKDSHSKRNELSSPVIPVPPPLNYSFINPPKLSYVCQQSSISSKNTPCDNRCFNCKYSHSKINKLSSPVIPVPPLLNDSVINPYQLSSVRQQSSSSSQNTTPESQAY